MPNKMQLVGHGPWSTAWSTGLALAPTDGSDAATGNIAALARHGKWHGLAQGAPIMSLKKCHSVPTKGQLFSDIMALF